MSLQEEGIRTSGAELSLWTDRSSSQCDVFQVRLPSPLQVPYASQVPKPSWSTQACAAVWTSTQHHELRLANLWRSRPELHSCNPQRASHSAHAVGLGL